MRIAIPIVNAITRQSIRTVASRGVSAGRIAFSHARPFTASSIPNAPPHPAKIALSVKTCRQILQRPAPRAARTAISFCRVVARASSRLATFAQAMSRTRLMAPSRRSNFVLAPPTRPS